ncbi:MAG: tetratricopeptide repeat protein [Calditrichaeota bacterium]|nr:tetratricopeptide repeat protein [Calditrichota bacterium]MCB9391151.1 tetratricopeptide repeat protein [Calditrichota bacterium]
MRRVSLALWLLAGALSLVWIAGCQSGPGEQELFDKATAAQEQSDFPTAIKAYQDLVSKYPKSTYAPKCQFMMGYLYANHMKDTAKAKAAYQDFIKNYPEDQLIKDAQWELDHLGMDVNEIEELNKMLETSDTTATHQG